MIIAAYGEVDFDETSFLAKPSLLAPVQLPLVVHLEDLVPDVEVPEKHRHARPSAPTQADPGPAADEGKKDGGEEEVETPTSEHEEEEVKETESVISDLTTLSPSPSPPQTLPRTPAVGVTPLPQTPQTSRYHDALTNPPLADYSPPSHEPVTPEQKP
ncbi:hypothetical protein OF83DRAFT_1087250 [Amylostereum chailletii]|nr:hypothetical protein OF83DRAFT_1087250 [Amylostereum chailletii]